MLFVVLCPGTPEGSTGSGSGFKASQKTGQRLKVSSDRLGEAGNRYPGHMTKRAAATIYSKHVLNKRRIIIYLVHFIQAQISLNQYHEKQFPF